VSSRINNSLPISTGRPAMIRLAQSFLAEPLKIGPFRSGPHVKDRDGHRSSRTVWVRQRIKVIVALPPAAAQNTSIMNWNFCPHCGVIIRESAERCGRCHALLTPPTGTAKRWFLLARRFIEKRIVPPAGQARTAAHWVWLLLLLGIATAGLVVFMLVLARMTSNHPRTSLDAPSRTPAARLLADLATLVGAEGSGR
jgi:hypothetical protein